MRNGWIKLHKKLLDNPIFRDADLLQLFIYCLLRANFEDKKTLWNGKTIELKIGQFITGLHVLCEVLNQKQTSIYRRMKILEKFEYINIKTENKYSIITVCKYKTYQLEHNEDGKQMENKRKTNGKQMETEKKYKNIKEKNYAFVEKDFEEPFYRWLKYKKNKGQTYKDEDSLEICYNKLKNMSGNNPLIAMEIIKDAMGKNYSGFFPLKENGKPIQLDTDLSSLIDSTYPNIKQSAKQINNGLPEALRDDPDNIAKKMYSKVIELNNLEFTEKLKYDLINQIKEKIK